MRIGLNLLYLIPGIVGGTETYAMGLLNGLKQLGSDYEFVLFLNRESAGLVQNDAPNFKSVVCPVYAENRKDRYYFEQVKLRQYLEKYKIGLLHSLGYTSPFFLRCPTVVSVPDLNFKAFGNAMPFARRLMLSLLVRQAVLRSDKVVTISNFSRQEILSEYHVPPEKIIVTYLAADVDNIKDKAESVMDYTLDLPVVKQPYIVAFSSVCPNKNISRLIEAFLDAKKKNRIEHKLVLIGHRYPVEKENQGAGVLGENKDIIWTGYLERQQVSAVLKRADFLVFPSFYEGFGLPLLEAMAAGVPVISSNAASMPEVADDASVFFDPFSVSDMAEKIVAVSRDNLLKAALREKGFKNLERFSWLKTAVETVVVYDELLQNRRAVRYF
jgi:glycosyltransferase involved in cell wall biosynthesis